MSQVPFEKIVSYVEGDLSAEEKTTISDMSETDTVLAEEIADIRLLVNSIHLAGEKEVEVNVKSFHQSFRNTQEFANLNPATYTPHIFVRFRNTQEFANLNRESSLAEKTEDRKTKFISLTTRYKLISLAAAILVLVIVTISIFNTPTKERLFSHYYSPEKDFLKSQIEYLDRSGLASADAIRRSRLKEALNQYESGDFQKSEDSLNKYLIGFPDDSVALLYLSLNKVEKKEYENSIQILLQLTKTNQHDIKVLSNWYLGLLYIRLDNMSAAKEYLTVVANEIPNIHAEEAKELLQKIE